MADSNKATVFAFYSYKGGTGRTTASANVAALLATKGHRVLCLDLDLEGPGIGIVFDITENKPFPLQNYFAGAHELSIEDFIPYDAGSTVKPRDSQNGGLWVVPASPRHAGAVDTTRGGRLLGQLRKLIDLAESALGVNVVIIDTPSGFGDLSALSMYVSNCVVALFRYSRQHVLGTARVSDFVKKYKLEFIAAASCVPLQDSPEKAIYTKMLKRFYPKTPIEIAEDDGLKWRERVIVGLTEENSSALSGYHQLAEELIRVLKD